jgi:hypothetical protein
MTRSGMIGIVLLLSVQLSSAQEFDKEYDLKAGKPVIIINPLGDIRVSAYDGDVIKITASVKGDDREKIQFIDRSSGNRVEIFTRYPAFPPGDARVDFEVRIPEEHDYDFRRLSSPGGNVEVSDVKGRLWAESVRGNVLLRNFRGLATASSVSGNILGYLDESVERNNIRFSSNSGNITVRAHADLDAFIEITSGSGSIKTDFPLKVQDMRYGPGQSAHGRLGKGIQILQISSIFGHIQMIKNEELKKREGTKP